MREQMVVTVTWSPSGKQWIVAMRAATQTGHLYLTTTSEDPYGTPLLESTARDALDAVAALMRGQYPW